VTHEEDAKRKALKRLAAQAGVGSRSSRSATSVEGRSNGRVMLFVGVTLITCLGWMTYSRLLNPSDKSLETKATAGVAHSSNQSGIASGTSTSAPLTRSAASDGSNSGPASNTPIGPKGEMQAHDEHLEKRVAAVEDFARRGDAKAVPAVLDALHDDDWRVRSRAMDAAVNAYVPIPESVLIDSAQSDPSPEVRFLALAGIAARIDPAIPQVPAIDLETARSLGRLALSDASEPVRLQAQQILDSLDASRAGPVADQSQGETL